MWWREPQGRGRVVRAALALALAALTAGCCQPLYGERTETTGGSVLREQLSAVDVLQIEAPKASDEARLAVEIRNALLFDLTGGGSSAPPTHPPQNSPGPTPGAHLLGHHTSRPHLQN